jgi:Uma2 family endonuclease
MSSSSTQTPKVHLATFEDLLRIPEDQRRHEILDGEIVEKAMPRWEHGVGQNRAGQLLGRFNRQPNGPTRPGGWWILTEPTIRLSRHETVQPDVGGWRRSRVTEGNPSYPVTLRPDWVCEIMCDGDARRRDGLQKRRIYADHDVPHYWLVDTERETLTVLRLTDQGYAEVLIAARADRVRAEPFDALELQVGVLFGDDED